MFTSAEMPHEGFATAADRMREARAALLLQRGRIAAVITIPVHPLFAVTDWFRFHDSVPIVIRLLTSLGVALVLAASYTRWGARHIYGLVFAGFVITGGGLASVLWQQGLFLTIYEGGFTLIILAFCVFIPATTAQAALVCVAILVTYFLPALIKYGSAMPSELVVIIVGLSSTTAIGLVGRHITNTLWEREFRARHSLQQALDELRTTQFQLLQAEKLAALGRLVAGVAHELNNPLSVINSNLYQLKRAAATLVREPEEGEASEAARQTITNSIELMGHGVERATAFVQHLRRHSTASRGEFSPTNLNSVVEQSVLLVETGARQRDITIHCEYGALPSINCDALSLSLVFVNVLENACDAVARSGNIWVRTETILEQNPPSPAKEETSVVITIKDDGPGVPPEHLTKLFDPFFTTKPPGAGMGLGLALARRIIEGHKGKIEAANGSPGVIVSITLPTTSSATSVEAESLHPLTQPARRDS